MILYIIPRSSPTKALEERPRSIKKVVALDNMMYVCYECGYQSKHSSNVKSHMKIHIGERASGLGAFESWDFKSATLPNMKHRKKAVYEDSSSGSGSFCYDRKRVGGAMTSTTLEKPFKCGQCDFETRKPGNLRAHVKLHESVKESASDMRQTKGSPRLNMGNHAGMKIQPRRCSYSCNGMANSIRHLWSKAFHCGDSCDCSKIDGLLRLSNRRSGKLCASCDLPGYNFNHSGCNSSLKSLSYECCCYQTCCKNYKRGCCRSYTGCVKPLFCDAYECLLSGDLNRLMISLSGEKFIASGYGNSQGHLSGLHRGTTNEKRGFFHSPSIEASRMNSNSIERLEQAALGSPSSPLMRSHEDVSYGDTQKPTPVAE